jgi:amino acid adenylation domain-containing protein
LGKELRRRGVKPNTLVAVVMEKGWEQIVGVYGVLMSGGAYLPLDADLPKERLWSLLERGEVREVVTVGEVRERVEWPEGMGVIAVDEMEWEMGTEPPARVQGVEDLAYVIFTSGSTGEPKGVMIDHRGAVNTIEDLNERYGIGRGDRVLGLSSLSFDLSVYDIFGMCGAGGAVVLPGKGMEKDPGHWQELMEQERVTVWNTVPALMQMLVEYQEGRGGGKGELRLVMLSGDWIPVSLPERVKGRWGGAKVVSLGGATEASIWSIYYEIEEVKGEWKSIPYGWPLRNQKWAIVNEQGEEVPDWVTGQLMIGGDGVALGYWRDEERTRKSFWKDGEGVRWYRTGDLGRYLGGGAIEFLGREDHQVKVNGYRIELGEVESAIGSYEGVKEGVVLAVGEQHSKQLVAYVVLDTKQSGAQLGDAYAPQSDDGVVRDPVARLEFKLRREGLRRVDGPRVKLPESVADSDSILTEYLRRQSYREFLGGDVELTQLSGLLESLKALERDEFAIPSFAILPREAVSGADLCLRATGACSRPRRGFHYYDPQRHELVMLQGGQNSRETILERATERSLREARL